MTELSVIRIRTKATLLRPEVAQLILRGARACGFPVSGQVLADLALEIADPRIGCFLGTVNDEPRGIAIGQLPLSAFMLAPMLVLAYSERAPDALVRLVAYRFGEWLVNAGFDRVMTLNLRHTDRAVFRRFADFGVPIRAGSVIAFDLRHHAAGEPREWVGR